MADTAKSRFKQLLVVFYNRPADILTIDNLIRFPTLKTARRDTLCRYLIKATRASLIEKVHLSHDQSGYRSRDQDRLRAYINGQTMTDWTKPPLKPASPFPIADYHKIEYDVALNDQEITVALQNGELHPNQRTGGCIVLNLEQFTIVANAKSGRGQAWLRLGWDTAISRLFGSRLQADLSKQVEERTGQRHISLPVAVANKRINLGGSTMLLAGSHYPLEIDLQGMENDDLAVKALEMATDSIKFNRVLLDISETVSAMRRSQNGLESALVALSEGFKGLASSQSDLNSRLSALLKSTVPASSISSEVKPKPGGDLIGYT